MKPYINAIKKEMANLKAMLELIEKAEDAKFTAKTISEYEATKQEAKDACREMKDSLNKIADYASWVTSLSE